MSLKLTDCTVGSRDGFKRMVGGFALQPNVHFFISRNHTK